MQEIPTAEVDASSSCIWFYFVIWHNNQVCATHHVQFCCPKPAAIHYPDIIQDFRQTPHLAKFSCRVCMFVCLTAEHMPSSCMYSCDSYLKGVYTDAADNRTFREKAVFKKKKKAIRAVRIQRPSLCYYLIKDTNTVYHTIKCKLSPAMFVFLF